MRVMLVGDRPVLNQRLAQLMTRRGFTVSEASLHDGVVDLLAEEPYDVMLLLAPEDEESARDLILTSRDVRPSLHVYLLANDGGLSQMLPGLQPALGKKVSVNDLPSALQEAVERADTEREHYRLEWLRYVEELGESVSTASTVKEAAQKLTDELSNNLRCDGCALVLLPEPGRKGETVITSGETDDAVKVVKDRSSIYQWISDNQSPLLARRGRSTIPGIQRDMVKYALGPSIFVPVMTTQRLSGVLMATREQEGQPFSDSAFAVVRMAAKLFALRIGGDLDTSVDEVREMLEHEREWRQRLEDDLGGAHDMLRRLTREVATVLERVPGQRASQAETIARLSMSLAEQLEVGSEHLQEAVYLRHIGRLNETLPSAGDARDGEGAADLARSGFEILSRVRLPAACLEVARHHRENYDGAGVPDGLKGEEIPILARIVRVVEDYVHMTSLGDGEGPLPSPEALSRMQREANKTYDPTVVDTFAKLIRAQGVTPEQETLSVIAHELRTPLTFLVGFSELLAGRTDLPPQAKDMASELHKQTEDMVVLTEKLLELSRLQSGRVSLSWQWVDLKAMVEEQVAKSRTLSDAHTFSVVLPSFPVRIRADATRLGQAIGNLLSNAVKYSPDGGEISVRLHETASEVTLSVKDEGVGIPGDKLRRLFQPFYRVQDARTQNIEGLGLGLALTRAMIEAHGGKISAESETGHGSTFTFSVPKQESLVEPASVS